MLKRFSYFVFFTFLFACNGKSQTKEKHSSKEIERFVVYYPETNVVEQKSWVENGRVFYTEKFDTLGNFVEDIRIIDVNPVNKIVKAGEIFEAKIYVKGPKPCDDLIYYVTDLIPIDSSRIGRAAHIIENTIGDRATIKLKTEEAGDFYIIGVIAISCDTATYPRQYNFRKEFTVTE